MRASAALSPYLQAAGWDGAGRVLEVEAVVRGPTQPARPVRQEVRDVLTSLPATASRADALPAVRQHGHLENRLHWPRDMTLGEDACQVRSGHAPQALAGVRNAVVGLLHLHHLSTLAAALRANAWSGPTAVLGLLGLTPS